MHITIIGAGAFGHALALMLQHHHEIVQYDIMSDWIAVLQTQRHHPIFYPDHKISDNVTPTIDLKEALRNPEIIILAVPAQAMQKACESLKPHINKAPVLNVAKGIDVHQKRTMHEIIRALLPNNEVATLSGGMLAQDIVAQHPTGATVACSANVQPVIEAAFKECAIDLQFTTDAMGVDLAGALKNILAIGAGIAESFSASTRAMVIVHLAKELEDFAVQKGAMRATFDGTYCWWGDIFTTAFGQSRNRWFGELRGRDLSTDEILAIAKKEHKTVEGVETLRALRHDLKTPMLQKLYAIVHEGASVSLLTTVCS